MTRPRPARAAAFVLAALSLAACADAGAHPSATDRAVVDAARSGAPHPDAAHAHHTAEEHAALLVSDASAAPGAISSASVYNLTGQWWDATGASRPLSSLAGRPQVVAMVYTHCAQACPAIVSELKRIEVALGPDAARAGIALASMDPQRDTPERLAEFAARAALDHSRWTLLGAPDGDVLELAAVLGVQFRRLPDGEFTHSNTLVVLDARGEIMHRQSGLGAGTAATVAAVRSALARGADR